MGLLLLESVLYSFGIMGYAGGLNRMRCIVPGASLSPEWERKGTVCRADHLESYLLTLYDASYALFLNPLSAILRMLSSHVYSSGGSHCHMTARLWDWLVEEELCQPVLGATGESTNRPFVFRPPVPGWYHITLHLYLPFVLLAPFSSHSPQLPTASCGPHPPSSTRPLAHPCYFDRALDPEPSEQHGDPLVDL
jgi:hypothetical protein